MTYSQTSSRYSSSSMVEGKPGCAVGGTAGIEDGCSSTPWMGIENWPEQMRAGKGRTLSYTRQIAGHVAHVEDSMGRLIGDLSRREDNCCSAPAVLGTAVDSAEPGVDGTRVEGLGTAEARRESVVEQSEVGVLRTGGQLVVDRSIPGFRLAVEAHDLTRARERSPDIVVVGTPPTYGGSGPDTGIALLLRGSRYETESLHGTVLVPQGGQVGHNHPVRQDHRSLHRTCPRVFSFGHPVGCALDSLVRRRSCSGRYSRRVLGISSHYIP